MKGLVTFLKRRWKFIAGLIFAMVGLDLATKGEYQAGWNDCCATADKLTAKYGPDHDWDSLTDEETQEAYNEVYNK